MTRFSTPRISARLLAVALSAAVSTTGAQVPATAASAWTAGDDHKQMMEQLGIRALRPGPSGNIKVTEEVTVAFPDRYREERRMPFGTCLIFGLCGL